MSGNHGDPDVQLVKEQGYRALTDEYFTKGISRTEIEDIIFHDVGRFAGQPQKLKATAGYLFYMHAANRIAYKERPELYTQLRNKTRNPEDYPAEYPQEELKRFFTKHIYYIPQFVENIKTDMKINNSLSLAISKAFKEAKEMTADQEAAIAGFTGINDEGAGGGGAEGGRRIRRTRNRKTRSRNNRNRKTRNRKTRSQKSRR